MVTTNLAQNLSTAELAEKYIRLKIKYEDRLKALLPPIVEELKHFSWFCSKIYAITDGQYTIVVSRNPAHLEHNGEPDDSDMEITASILESEDWSSSVLGGVDFRITVISYSGERIGSFPSRMFESASYNEWIPITDEEAIEARFKVLESVDPHDILVLLQRIAKGRAAR